MSHRCAAPSDDSSKLLRSRHADVTTRNDTMLMRNRFLALAMLSAWLLEAVGPERGDAGTPDQAGRGARGHEARAQARAIKDWDKLNADEKKLHARQMEVFAGFGGYADTEIGRLIDEGIRETGQIDNTLIFYCVGDSGASAEGGMNGLYADEIELCKLITGPGSAGPTHCTDD